LPAVKQPLQLLLLGVLGGFTQMRMVWGGSARVWAVWTCLPSWRCSELRAM